MELIHYLYFPLYLFYIGLFVWLILKGRFFETDGVNKKHLVFFFLLKATAGIALMLIYTYYYTDPAKADIHRYFRDSKIISSILFHHPLAWLKIITGIGIHDKEVYRYLLPTLYYTHSSGDIATTNTFITRIISLANYFSLYNIYIDTLFFDFISFTGLFLLFKALKVFVGSFWQILYLPLFLVPSVIFWGSGLLKESILLSGTGLYVYSVIRWSETGNGRYFIGLLIALLILASTKIYIAAVLVLCTLALPVPVSRNKKMIAVILAGALAWHFAGSGFCERIIDKRNEFVQLAISENAGSSLDNTMSQPDCAHLYKLLPSSLANAILRPFIWEKGKAFQKIFALENTLLLLLMFYVLLRYFKWPSGTKRRLAIFCFLFALLNYMVIGITIPVMGAIVHYRIIAGVFMLVTVVLLVDEEKIGDKPG